MVPLPQSLVNVVAFPLQLIAADLAVECAALDRDPGAARGQHHPSARHAALRRRGVQRPALADGARDARRRLRVLLPQEHGCERIVLVASAIPIAIVVNAFRVALTGILTHNFGEQAAEGVIHQTEGLFTFGLAFALLLVEACAARRCCSGASREAAAAPRSPRMTKLAVALAFLALELLHLSLPGDGRGDPAAPTLRAFPLRVRRLVVSRSSMPMAERRRGEPRRHRLPDLRLQRQDRPARVGVYVGYHAATGARGRRRLGRELDPPAGPLPAGLRLGHHRASRRSRSTCPACRRRTRRVKRLRDREGRGAPARLLLVPAAGPRDRRGLAEDRLRRSATARCTAAPTARSCASRSRSRATGRPSADADVPRARSARRGAVPRLPARLRRRAT